MSEPYSELGACDRPVSVLERVCVSEGARLANPVRCCTAARDVYVTFTLSFSRRSYPERLTVNTGTFPPEACRVKCLAQGHNVIWHGQESNRHRTGNLQMNSPIP